MESTVVVVVLALWC